MLCCVVLCGVVWCCVVLCCVRCVSLPCLALPCLAPNCIDFSYHSLYVVSLTNIVVHNQNFRSVLSQQIE